MARTGDKALLFLQRGITRGMALALFLLALSLAACSPQVTPTPTATVPPPTPTPTATPVPQARLEQAVTRLQSARSFQFSLDMQGVLTGQGLSLTVPVKADGAFVAPDRRRVKVSGSFLGQPFGVEQVRIGNTVYSRENEQSAWTQGTVADQFLPPALSGLGQFVTPDTGATALLATARSAQAVGEEDLNGEKTLHLTAQIPVQGLGESFQGSAATLQVDLWVGTGDGLPRKMVIGGKTPVRVPEGAFSSGMGAILKDATLDLTATLLFSQFNAPFAIGSPLAAASDANKPAIILADTQHESIGLNNAIARFILEKGYGYPVEVVQTIPSNAIPQLGRGDVDVLLEASEQDFKDAYDRESARGTVRNLGTLYQGTQQFFIIPKWVHDQHGVSTVRDMANPAVAALFQDPSVGVKGAFLSCMAALPCSSINDIKLEAYGLNGLYATLRAADPSALETALQNAQKDRKALFAYYWGPSPLLGSGEWYVLQEPPHDPACWSRVVQAQRDPSLRPLASACAYPSASANVLVSSGLAGKAPDAAQMLDRMALTVEALSEASAWMRKNATTNYTAGAVHFLLKNRDQWTVWVSQDVAERIIGQLPLPGEMDGDDC